MCVNTSKHLFCVSSALKNMNFIDTDLISLLTAQMSYYSNSLIKHKDLTQKIMHTFRKNGFIQVKISLNLLENINFFLISVN